MKFNKKQYIWLVAVISTILLIGGGIALIATYGSMKGTSYVGTSITVNPTTFNASTIAGENVSANVTITNTATTRRIAVAFNGSITPLNGGGNVEFVWFNTTLCNLNTTTQIFDCPVEQWSANLGLTRPVIYQMAPAAVNDTYTYEFNATAINPAN